MNKLILDVIDRFEIHKADHENYPEDKFEDFCREYIKACDESEPEVRDFLRRRDKRFSIEIMDGSPESLDEAVKSCWYFDNVLINDFAVDIIRAGNLQYKNKVFNLASYIKKIVSYRHLLEENIIIIHPRSSGFSPVEHSEKENSRETLALRQIKILSGEDNISDLFINVDHFISMLQPYKEAIISYLGTLGGGVSLYKTNNRTEYEFPVSGELVIGGVQVFGSYSMMEIDALEIIKSAELGDKGVNIDMIPYSELFDDSTIVRAFVALEMARAKLHMEEILYCNMYPTNLNETILNCLSPVMSIHPKSLSDNASAKPIYNGDDCLGWKLSLPYFEGVSPNTLLELRESMPNAFLDFRSTMEEFVVESRLNDSDEIDLLQKKLDKEVYSCINHIESEMLAVIRSSKKYETGTLSLGAALLAGSTIISGGLSWPGLAGAGAAAAAVIKSKAEQEKNTIKMQGKPFYFVWKAKHSK